MILRYNKQISKNKANFPSRLSCESLNSHYTIRCNSDGINVAR